MHQSAGAMVERAALAAAVLAIGSTSGCGRGPVAVQSESPTTAASLPSSEIHGPYVDAGAELTIALDAELATNESASGEPFTGTTQSALIGSDGRVLVPLGAQVLGHVASVASGGRPQILLAFDAVQTTLGASPLVATVIDVQQARAAVSEVERTLLSSPPTTLPPPGVPTTSFTTENDVVLPPGTRLRLEITRPLFAPGTFVAPEANRPPQPLRR